MNESPATPPGILNPDTRKSRIERLTWAALFSASAALLVSSIYRAATFPFTHDESLSFAIFTWVPRWSETANNHYLNTWLMEFCWLHFGGSELSLRLPSLLAHLIYLVCGLLVLKRFRHPLLRIAGFVLLNLNPFLLDFFFLARGYSLGLAFMMLSLYLFVLAFEVNPRRRFEILVFLSGLAGSLTVLANFTFLNYYLPLLLAGGILLLLDRSTFRFQWRRIPAAITFLYVNAMFLAFVFPALTTLQQRGELYYGGKIGFAADTVGSLVRDSLYLASGPPATQDGIAMVLMGLFGCMLLLGFWWLAIAPRGGATPFWLLLLTLSAAVALPGLEHALVESLFPIGRGALYYLPIYTVTLLWAFHLLNEASGGGWKRRVVLAAPLLLAAALGWNFYRNFSPDICYTWWYDRHNEEVLEFIKQDHERSFPGRVVKVGCDWLMEPSLNFYRGTRGYSWLEPLTRDPVTADGYDYLYVFESEVGDLAKGEYTKLASFPDTKTVLLRVD